VLGRAPNAPAEWQGPEIAIAARPGNWPGRSPASGPIDKYPGGILLH
jgi:hypothetical protein